MKSNPAAVSEREAESAAKYGQRLSTHHSVPQVSSPDRRGGEGFTLTSLCADMNDHLNCLEKELAALTARLEPILSFEEDKGPDGVAGISYGGISKLGSQLTEQIQRVKFLTVAAHHLLGRIQL